MYREYILDLYKNPLNKKEVDGFTAEYKEINANCGDEITVQVKAVDSLEDIGHQGHGCAISQAAVSLVTDWALGKTVDQVNALTDDEVIEMLGVEISYTRMKCALLGKKALQRAIYE